MRNDRTNACLYKLNKYCEKEGQSKRVISEHGSQFDTSKWQKNLEKRGIKVGYTTIRHLQSNPSERTTISIMLRIMCAENTSTQSKNILIRDIVLPQERYQLKYRTESVQFYHIKG